MKSDLAAVFQGGRIKDIDVLNSSTFSVDTQNHHEACPANKRWRVLSVLVDPDNSSTITVYIKDSGDLLVCTIGNQGAGTAPISFPDGPGAAGELSLPLILLKATDYIDITYGAAQGATSRIKIRVLEYDV